MGTLAGIFCLTFVQGTEFMTDIERVVILSSKNVRWRSESQQSLHLDGVVLE